MRHRVELAILMVDSLFMKGFHIRVRQPFFEIERSENLLQKCWKTHRFVDMKPCILKLCVKMYKRVVLTLFIGVEIESHGRPESQVANPFGGSWRVYAHRQAVTNVI